MTNKWKQASVKRYLVLIVVGLLAAAGVFQLIRSQAPRGDEHPIPASSEGGDVVVDGGGSSEMVDREQQFLIRLSEGRAEPQEAQPLTQVTGTPLSEAELEQVLSRLPEILVQADDQVDFQLAQDPIPPPRTGETVLEPFPPPPDAPPPEQVAQGPLEVLRYGPEGEIPLAPFINLTFNQPMVPLTALDDLAAAAVPVQIEPDLPGRWRWVSPKNLTFEYDSDLIDRLPKATVYRVTVPAGTRSATGGELQETVEWTFTTPAPKMTLNYPSGIPQPADALFFIAFDQRIDPAAVLETIRVSTGGRVFALRLAEEDEIQADENVSRLVEGAQEGRWLAFRTQEPLPLDSDITVEVGPGTPSAEGPLLTEQAQTFSFRTYAPLRIIEHGCAWSHEQPCPPLTPFYIQFNNPIDPAVYTDTLLTIRPELPGANVNIFGDRLEIQGATSAQTTYTISVSPGIQDIFGQTLDRGASLNFRVGRAESVLYGPEQLFVTLDPSLEQPVFSVYSLNYTRLGVKIYAVQPEDWTAFKTYLREYQRTGTGTPPGRLALDRNLPVESPSDTLTEVGIDLNQVMDGDFGHFIVVVEPPRSLGQDREYWRTIHAWVQVTQIGLDAFTDHSEMVVWTTSLKDGAPLGGVTVQAGPGEAVATTGEDGVARFPIPDGAQFLIASRGADRALLPRSSYYWGDDYWQTRPVRDEIRWYVFDDRQMYRPGEDVHVKGWLRQIGGKQDGDVGLVSGELTTISYQVIDPQGNELVGGTAEVTALGGFDFAFTVPDSVNLGYAQIILHGSGLAGEQPYYHSFQIQEFRRPEFEVTARNETAPPYFAGEHAVVAVEAKYYAGDPLPGAEVTWHVYSSPASYAPPNWPDFVFGVWEPWWGRAMMYEYGFSYGGPGETKVETFTGQTDFAGQHYLRLDFDSLGEPLPVSIQAEATVMDVNRQAWTGKTDLLVHPADLYVGLRSERMFVNRGKPLIIEAIVTDLDGNPIPDRSIEVRAARLDWKYRNGSWVEEEADVQTCSTVSTLEPVTCTFETPVGGSYRITAEVSDDLGRLNRSQMTRWVSGGERPPSRRVEQETVTLIPDKDSYQPGDVAQVLVQSPFSPAEGLLTVSRNGMLYTRRFRVEEGTATLEIPIEDTHIPNLNLQVDLVGSAERTGDAGEPVPGAPPRPAYASGSLTLSVPPFQRTLTLELAPAESELEPGGETTIDVLLTDARGNPVPGAELAVVVVDEAVLALSGYNMRDPLEIFYSNRPAYFEGVYGRASLILADPLALAKAAGMSQRGAGIAGEAMEAEMPAMAAQPPMATTVADMDSAAGDGAGAPSPIRVRTDFNPLAAFVPAATTGPDGAASIPIHLPDNLTRYRVMVVAAAGGSHFGSAETNLVARLPLMVRPSAPRFLNFGDQFELPVVLQNQTGEPLVVDVALQTANLELTGVAGQRVSVPAHDRVEVRFPATTVNAGTARFQVAAVSGDYADAAVMELPVYTPATTEAFVTYGVIDDGALAQPVTAPGDVIPQYGGLEISTSSTALQSLTDAVLYLVSYPFDCTEQIASRVLGIAALRDVLSAFQAEGLPSPQELEIAVQQDIERLAGLQNDDGGFPYWQRGRESIPFNSIHVAHALYRARTKGFAVPLDTELRLRDHLRQIEDYYPHWYSQRTRYTLSAYALYVRDLMGDNDSQKALRLFNEWSRSGTAMEEMTLDAIGWLWPVLSDDPSAGEALEQIRRHVNNRAVETAGAANFTTEYDEQSYLLLNSNRRTDAILLDALIGDNPQHDLIPKVVNGLLAHRTRGRWENTQENVFVLLVLDRYFNTYEAQTPDFVARIWLGEGYAGGHEYRGRTTERHETLVPMQYLLDAGEADLILSKEGAGRLYYRLGLRYAPADLEQEPLDMGFVVSRSYEAVDDPEDVFQDENGVWHIRAGARVRVRVTMVADNRRYHVALVDPLPAGLEPVNPALEVSGTIPQDPGSQKYRYGWWWWGTWYEHQNLRDERAEAFASLVWDGIYEYTYIARATTPGRFVVPPAKAEEMYSPEVFGRSASDIVIVR